VHGRVFDAVVGWHYRLGSDLFLTYSDQPFSDSYTGTTVQDRRFLTKASFSF
jgi:hypothetical protein